MLHFNHNLRIKMENRRRSIIRLTPKLKKLSERSAKKLSNVWFDFFHKGSLLLLQAIELENELTPNYFFTESFEALKEQNYRLHKERLDENYKESYANPTYAVKCFGICGQLNSVIYSQILQLPKAIFEYDILTIFQVADLFYHYYLCWKREGENYNAMRNLFKSNSYTMMYELSYASYEKRFSPKFDFYTLWIKTVDLTDLRYLFFYGDYVDDDTITLVQYLNSLTQVKIDEIMRLTASAFIKGFAEGGKKYQRKKNVRLQIPLGMERLARSLIFELEERYHFKVCMSHMVADSHGKQLEYDHRFSNAIYLDEVFAERYLLKTRSILDDLGKLIRTNAGIIAIDPFGDQAFTPESKPECLKYTPEQTEISQSLQSKISIIYHKYYRRNENSYCYIGFPTPSIGKHFPEIFSQIIDINMLNHEQWLNIQQYLIDALDQADYVHIKGCGKNKTDIKIKIPRLINPSAETNFFNCGATVNIPVGEVFCTPQLDGTKGVLHIPKTFLNGLQYNDLRLTFVDGRITDYSCENYENEADNKKYIAENLLFPYHSLPLGEFAIGTNTLAYSVAKRYNIVPVLPILIIEKMGPHFAIGDTCYSWEEDVPVYNPDKKRVISTDNEQSILRKDRNPAAYYYKHIDITLPFDEIGSIQAVLPRGNTIEIIKKGKFVLHGTSELNDYL